MKRTIRLQIDDFETGYQDKPQYQYVETSMTDEQIELLIESLYNRWDDNGETNFVDMIIRAIGRRTVSLKYSTFNVKSYKLKESEKE